VSAEATDTARASGNRPPSSTAKIGAAYARQVVETSDERLAEQRPDALPATPF
jgi:hypothetical protein